MSLAGVLGSLLQVEENFCSCLARIDELVLKPLLQAEPREPQSQERSQRLRLLRERFQRLWDFSEENSRSLRGSSSRGCIRDFHTLGKGETFLGLYIQYFVTLGNFLVLPGLEQVAKGRSEAWKELLREFPKFQRDLPPEEPPGPVLPSLLQEPFRAHLRSHLELLEQLRELLQEDSQRVVVCAVQQELRKLECFIAQALGEAERTRQLWRALSPKLTEVLCVPERRLLEDSRDLPIAAGTARSQRLLLFDDVLVLIQGNSFQSFDLKLVWVDENSGEESAPGCCRLRVTTPEETLELSARDPQSKAVWRWKLEQAARQALNGKRDFPLWGRSGEGGPAPAQRCFSYAFRGEGRLRGATYEGQWLWGKPHGKLRGATYEGQWLWGKPHGKGTLKWRDGRNHVGDFQQGLEHGFGIRLVPRGSGDHYDCYKCHWQRGRMSGYGICEYGNDSVYKGYFKDDARHGFGILEDFSSKRPYKYTGHWERDRKHGYGVWEDKERGERYVGMWLDDHRHGEGIVVTHWGLCYQRMFLMDKMVGSGIILLEDDSVYEGSFTEDLGWLGKEKIPNGYFLEGKRSSLSGREIQLGLKEFPVEKRWPGIFQQFQEFLRSGCREETEEAFTGFHVQSSRELKSQEFQDCEGGSEVPICCRSPELLQELGQLQELPELLRYLEKALSCSLHPLGKLLGSLSVAFQATFGGLGANRHLLPMAQAEVKFYARKIWEFFRELLRLAWERRGWEPPQDAEPSLQQGSSLVLPLILPCFYPELSMLYMLHHQREDNLYGQGIVELSHLPDIQLLEFLDVQKHLWPLKDLTLTSNQRHSLIKDKCFLSATECLQKLITTVDPREKLEILQQTYQELERTVSRVLGQEHRLPMDDLLPLLIFVVSRARIQHLGAEIHLIRDLMDPTNQGGMLDFLLTALESCYEHIQRIRLQPKENSQSS